MSIFPLFLRRTDFTVHLNGKKIGFCQQAGILPQRVQIANRGSAHYVEATERSSLLSYDCRNRDLPCVLALSPVHFLWHCAHSYTTGRLFLFYALMVTPNIEIGSDFLLSQKEQQ
jgi:hypothetical protein